MILNSQPKLLSIFDDIIVIKVIYFTFYNTVDRINFGQKH